ncbi:MAG TPA: hypothetical protein ENH31_04700 [Nitrospirae bacterium]|nr:hypothetical protein [Nitrospirota bacterium]
MIMFYPVELPAEDKATVETEAPAEAEEPAKADEPVEAEKEITVEEVIEVKEVRPLPPFKQEVLFEDHFQDNKNKWMTEKNPFFSTYIENGKYIISQTAEGSIRAVTNFLFSLPDNIDFIIEASIEKTPARDNLGFGLIWGSSDINNQYRFYISDNGNYSIIKREKGVTSDIVAWKKYKETGEQKNKLTVLKYGDNTHFYVNDEHIDSVPGLSPPGSGVGFVMDGKQAISIDYIRVTQIEAENPDSDIKPLEPEETPVPESSK